MQQDHGDKSSVEVEELLASIEQGNTPLTYLLDRLLDLLVKLDEKERKLQQVFQISFCFHQATVPVCGADFSNRPARFKLFDIRKMLEGIKRIFFIEQLQHF